jgi:hypothetical protein
LEDEKLRPTGSRQSLPRSTDGTDDVQESVIILLPAFNGAAHIGAQLQSIADQSFRAWQLWVADDGSTDATIDIVDRFARAHSQTVRCLAGPRKGVTANALGLLTTPDLPSGTAIAFCDQDDVWHPQKLERALSTLAKQNGPALYCSRTEIGLDPDGPLRRSPDWNRPPSFTNALVQSIAGANTMVLNAEAVAIARKAARGPLPAFHDWWLYQVVTGVGGTVCFRPRADSFLPSARTEHSRAEPQHRRALRPSCDSLAWSLPSLDHKQPARLVLCRRDADRRESVAPAGIPSSEAKTWPLRSARMAPSWTS